MDYDYEDDEVTPVNEDWEDKYRKLKVNFDRLDRHNDLLYRIAHAAKLYVKATDNPNYFQFMRDELLARLLELEDYEKGLKK